MSPKFYPLGDSCCVINFGKEISKELSLKILHLYKCFKSPTFHSAILDVVPTYNAIAFYFDLSKTSYSEVSSFLQNTLSNITLEEQNNLKSLSHLFKINYCGEDLQRLASIHKLSIQKIIELHTQPTYTVAMIGFKPHFPYLIGLDSKLSTPRLESPRTHVSPGAVAIGGDQTGIYPSSSPGGWNILGYTDPAQCKKLQPGDQIRFEAL